MSDECKPRIDYLAMSDEYKPRIDYLDLFIPKA